MTLDPLDDGEASRRHVHEFDAVRVVKGDGGAGGVETQDGARPRLDLPLREGQLMRRRAGRGEAEDLESGVRVVCVCACVCVSVCVCVCVVCVCVCVSVWCVSV